MSEETGGHLFRVDRKQTLQQIFDDLNQELRTQYSFAYTPTNPTSSGGYRKIEIRLSNKDLKVQTRKGYYATSTAPQ
jgi:VWFA-related protein